MFYNKCDDRKTFIRVFKESLRVVGADRTKIDNSFLSRYSETIVRVLRQAPLESKGLVEPYERIVLDKTIKMGGNAWYIYLVP